MVAKTLGAMLSQNNYSVEYSYEMPDCTVRSNENHHLTAPDQIDKINPKALLHLHSTQDWLTILSSVKEKSKAVLTMHDGRLLSGGCISPLQCALWKNGCRDCPRAFPNSAAVQTLMLKLLRRDNHILISPSKWLAKMLAQALPDKRAVVIPNGVNAPACTLLKGEARTKLGLPPKTPILMFIAHGGEQAAYKAGDKWRDIFRTIANRIEGALGLFIGGEKTAKENNLMLWPYLDSNYISAFMKAADLLVYPTLADNHPLIVLEAMRHALPVAATAVGGIPEQIEHGRTGLLVPPGNWQELALAATHLLSKPSEARALGLEARYFADSHFSAERMSKDYIKVYEKICSARK